MLFQRFPMYTSCTVVVVLQEISMRTDAIRGVLICVNLSVSYD